MRLSIFLFIAFLLAGCTSTALNSNGRIPASTSIEHDGLTYSAKGCLFDFYCIDDSLFRIDTYHQEEQQGREKNLGKIIGIGDVVKWAPKRAEGSLLVEETLPSGNKNITIQIVSDQRLYDHTGGDNPIYRYGLYSGCNKYDSNRLCIGDTVEATKMRIEDGTPYAKYFGKIEKMFPRGNEVLICLVAEKMSSDIFVVTEKPPYSACVPANNVQKR